MRHIFGLFPLPSNGHRQDDYMFRIGDSYKHSYVAITGTKELFFWIIEHVAVGWPKVSFRNKSQESTGSINHWICLR